MNKFCGPLGPTSARTNNLRQLIRKRPALTLSVQTSPTAHSHLHHHGGALHREVLKMTEVSAVPTRRRRAASGTGDHFRPAAEITQRSPSRSTPRTRTSGPGAQSMFFRMLAHRRDARSNQPARKVKQTLSWPLLPRKLTFLRKQGIETCEIDLSKLLDWRSLHTVKCTKWGHLRGQSTPVRLMLKYRAYSCRLRPFLMSAPSI